MRHSGDGLAAKGQSLLAESGCFGAGYVQANKKGDCVSFGRRSVEKPNRNGFLTVFLTFRKNPWRLAFNPVATGQFCGKTSDSSGSFS
jgi:hypothetical protein